MEKEYEDRRKRLKERYQARKSIYEERYRAKEAKAEVTAPPPVEERVEREAEEEVKVGILPEVSGEEEKIEGEVIKHVLTDIKGIGPARASKLEEAGIKSVEDLAKSTAEEIVEIVPVPVIKAAEWIKKAEELK
ncbi:MAG: helix-hairpin-helix domain-containing protein [Halobacteriota archaeon]